jgi:plastocyanin
LNLSTAASGLAVAGLLLLTACQGGSAPATPTRAPAPTPTTVAAVASPAAPASPAASPPAAAAPAASPSPAAKPAEPAPVAAKPAAPGGPLGTAAIKDDLVRNDQLLVSLTNVPPAPAGQVYQGWMTVGGQPRRPAGGPMPVGADRSIQYTWTAADGANLIAGFDGFAVTAEPERGGPPPAAPSGPVVFKGEVPPKALVHVRHLLAAFPAAPEQTALSTGMFEQATELRRHAEFMRDSVRGNDLDGVKRHAEHIVNLIEGEKGPNYGDLNKDGKVQNPGDGYGLLENGNQLGYLKGAADHARLAAQTDDANETIRVHSGHVQIAAENVQGFAAATRDLAREVLTIPNAPAAEARMQQVLAQADRALNGVDTNNNEQVEPIKGEAGSKIGYQHSQFMAIMTITAAQPAAGAGPAAAGSLSLDMTDNQFSLKTVTVPVGTTITWNNKSTGRRHSATAENGSFDTDLLDPGKSGTATLATPGTFAYYCKLHGGPGGQGMAATIVVEGGAPAAAASAPPPTLPAVLPTTPPAPKPAAPTAPPPPPAAPPAPPAAPAGPVAVDIANFAFGQKNLSVKVGTSVTWTNKDRAPHTVTADGKQFDSGNLTNGKAFTFQAAQAGTFPYFCEIHGGPGGQGMSGVLTVTP